MAVGVIEDIVNPRTGVFPRDWYITPNMPVQMYEMFIASYMELCNNYVPKSDIRNIPLEYILEG
jgi:hypothetical protein